MTSCRVSFNRRIWGVPFTVAQVDVRRARTTERARRAAEMRFARSRGVPDWQVLADEVAVESDRDRGREPTLRSGGR